MCPTIRPTPTPLLSGGGQGAGINRKSSPLVQDGLYLSPMSTFITSHVFAALRGAAWCFTSGLISDIGQ